MGKHTPFYQKHLDLDAKMISFFDWDMPLHYGSQLKEHHAVRQDAGLFDISHMTIIDLKGQEVDSYLKFILANDVTSLPTHGALYSCMLNENGGILDDLIVYKLSEQFFRLITNSSTCEKILNWLTKTSKHFSLTISHRSDLCILAVQGPNARLKLTHLFTPEELKIILDLKSFRCIMIKDYLLSRTGYTGEDGFELIFPSLLAVATWEKLIANGLPPCGLGARDTLRLEAGFNLYGMDMDETVTPLESNLAWTVKWQPREFIGRAALEKQLKTGLTKKLTGIILKTEGVIRRGQSVLIDKMGEGIVTSGTFSPTLNKGIGFARVPLESKHECLVNIRNRYIPAEIISPPFVRNGEKAFNGV